jgi:hypothetical protein
MNSSVRFAMLLASAFLVTACATTNPQRLEQLPSKVQKGTTTTAQVREFLGDPQHRRIDPEGETWSYGEAREKDTGDVIADQAVGIGVGFIPVPYIGTAVGSIRSIGHSTRSAQPSATIEFDKNGVVRDYTIEIP